MLRFLGIRAFPFGASWYNRRSPDFRFGRPIQGTPMTAFAFTAAVFLTAAGALVLEIVAARLIAPYVGMSLYTWTAIIAIVLWEFRFEILAIVSRLLGMT